MSGLGLCLGLILILFSIRIYSGVIQPAQEELGKADYVVISKDVSLGNTLLNSKARFNEKEIEELSKQSFTSDLAYFTPNQFTVKAYIPQFELGLDMFFESIPKSFIDNCPYQFSWEPGDELLPIIVSEDFINLYNYNFAIMNQLPQISPGSVTAVPLTIVLKGSKNQLTIRGRIVGYSERISSVLIPVEFMNWANDHLGGLKGSAPVSRMMIKVNKEYAASMESFLLEKGYMVNAERLGQHRITAMAGIITTILVILGGLFMLLSFIIVLQNFALVLSEARHDMILLFQLGYTIKSITLFLFSMLGVYLAGVVSISIALYWYGYSQLGDYLQHRQLESGLAITSEISVFIGLMMILLLTTGLFSIRFRIYRYS